MKTNNIGPHLIKFKKDIDLNSLVINKTTKKIFVTNLFGKDAFKIYDEMHEDGLENDLEEDIDNWRKFKKDMKNECPYFNSEISTINTEFDEMIGYILEGDEQKKIELKNKIDEMEIMKQFSNEFKNKESKNVNNTLKMYVMLFQPNMPELLRECFPTEKNIVKKKLMGIRNQTKYLKLKPDEDVIKCIYKLFK